MKAGRSVSKLFYWFVQDIVRDFTKTVALGMESRAFWEDLLKVVINYSGRDRSGAGGGDERIKDNLMLLILGYWI